MNPVEIEEAVSNLALEPFDRGEFPYQFLRAFGSKATGRLNKLYIELLKDNPDWASRREAMNHFMARLIEPAGSCIPIRVDEAFGGR